MRIELKRTTKEDAVFLGLVKALDAGLKITDGPDHAFYDQFNGTGSLDAVLVAYIDTKAVGCGAFRIKDQQTVEIKRMYTTLEYRQQGIARAILAALEAWAAELGYTNCILETGINQEEALQFYPKVGYVPIPRFPPYEKAVNSSCFGKKLYI